MATDQVYGVRHEMSDIDLWHMVELYGADPDSWPIKEDLRMMAAKKLIEDYADTERIAIKIDWYDNFPPLRNYSDIDFFRLGTMSGPGILFECGYRIEVTPVHVHQPVLYEIEADLWRRHFFYSDPDWPAVGSAAKKLLEKIPGQFWEWFKREMTYEN